MKQPLFTGVCTAIVTPFIGEQINFPMFEVLLRRQMEAGIPAIVICGTTGESPTLSDAEKTELFYQAKQIAGNQAKIIAGTGSNDTAHAVQLSLLAQKAGVDGLLVVSPYYNKATDDGLIRHYQAIATSVEIPVILYNVPSRTGLDIPVSVYQQLSKIPNIVGVKEASQSIDKVLDICTQCPDSFTVWSGNDSMTIPMISMGAKGVISVTANVIPFEMTRLVSCALSGNYPQAMTIQKAILPLTKHLFCQVNPIPVKEAMQLIGYDCGVCRLPLTTLTQENREKLKRLLT